MELVERALWTRTAVDCKDDLDPGGKNRASSVLGAT
jgi:hypothetical protein